MPFDITAADLSIPETCPVLGMRLMLNSGRGGKANSPSIDRIIPALGYTRGNVAVISRRANNVKHDATAEEIEAALRNPDKRSPKELALVLSYIRSRTTRREP